MSSKSLSLQRLVNKGLNTPEFMIITGQKELSNMKLPSRKDGYSIRTERGDEFKLPFHYKIKYTEVRKIGRQLLSEGYKLIICPSINTSFCKYRGTAVYFPDQHLCQVEYLVGNGTVRDMEEGANPRQMRIGSIDEADPPFSELYITMKRFFGQNPEIVEWSEYKIPVGRLKEHMIFWEVRPWS